MFSLFRRWFRKKTGNGLTLTTEQLSLMQRLSGHYLLRMGEATHMFPELSQELKAFYEKKGGGWEWFPKIGDIAHIQEQVRVNPQLYEIENTIPNLDRHQVEFRLAELGIRRTVDGVVLCRAKLYAYKVRTDSESSDYLAELSKI